MYKAKKKTWKRNKTSCQNGPAHTNSICKCWFFVLFWLPACLVGCLLACAHSTARTHSENSIYHKSSNVEHSRNSIWLSLKYHFTLDCLLQNMAFYSWVQSIGAQDMDTFMARNPCPLYGVHKQCLTSIQDAKKKTERKNQRRIDIKTHKARNCWKIASSKCNDCHCKK